MYQTSCDSVQWDWYQIVFSLYITSNKRRANALHLGTFYHWAIILGYTQTVFVGIKTLSGENVSAYRQYYSYFLWNNFWYISCHHWQTLLVEVRARIWWISSCWDGHRCLEDHCSETAIAPSSVLCGTQTLWLSSRCGLWWILPILLPCTCTWQPHNIWFSVPNEQRL